ncbi:MAG: hypothetical protein U1F45_05840 [Burkholderiales bacterium]
MRAPAPRTPKCSASRRKPFVVTIDEFLRLIAAVDLLRHDALIDPARSTTRDGARLLGMKYRPSCAC